MTIYEIAKKLHCILNRTDSLVWKHLNASISIGNIALIECDENSIDNIYIHIDETLASCFDIGLYGCVLGSKSYQDACEEAEYFLNSLRDVNGELIEWYFPDPFTIFIKMIEDGYVSSDIQKIYDYQKQHRKEYIEWRMTHKEL